MAQPTIAELIERTYETARIHGLDFRCPACDAGIGKWCIGTQRLAGPTDLNPSHQQRLALISKGASK